MLTRKQAFPKTSAPCLLLRLTPTQASIFHYFILQNKPLDRQEISEALDIRSNNVSCELQKLKHFGFIEEDPKVDESASLQKWVMTTYPSPGVHYDYKGLFTLFATLPSGRTHYAGL